MFFALHLHPIRGGGYTARVINYDSMSIRRGDKKTILSRSGNLKGKDHLEDTVVDGITILKQMTQSEDAAGSTQVSVKGNSEFWFNRIRKFLDQLGNYGMNFNTNSRCCSC
jgi:hypothetical protein